jgi:hypothetical protein
MDHELQSRENLLPQARAAAPTSTKTAINSDAASSMKGKEKAEQVYKLRQS